MKFWLTDHDHDLYMLSIRTEDNTSEGKPITPCVHQLPVRGNIVTTVGVMHIDDLVSLRDELNTIIDQY